MNALEVIGAIDVHHRYLSSDAPRLFLQLRSVHRKLILFQRSPYCPQNSRFTQIFIANVFSILSHPWQALHIYCLQPCRTPLPSCFWLLYPYALDSFSLVGLSDNTTTLSDISTASSTLCVTIITSFTDSPAFLTFGNLPSHRVCSELVQ